MEKACQTEHALDFDFQGRGFPIVFFLCAGIFFGG